MHVPVDLWTDPINVCDNVIFEAVQNPTLLSSTVFSPFLH